MHVEFRTLPMASWTYMTQVIGHHTNLQSGDK